MFLDGPGPFELPGGVVGGEHALQAGPGPVGEGVGATQQEAPVRPCRVDQPAATCVTFTHEALPHPGQGVVGELDQVERIDADRGVGQVLAHGLAERRGRVDRHHLDLVTPSNRPGPQPLADGVAVTPVDHPQHPPGVQVEERGHPRLVASPRSVGPTVVAHGSVPVLIDPQPAHHHRVNAGEKQRDRS